jgi:hypothetical protein
MWFGSRHFGLQHRFSTTILLPGLLHILHLLAFYGIHWFTHPHICCTAFWLFCYCAVLSNLFVPGEIQFRIPSLCISCAFLIEYSKVGSATIELDLMVTLELTETLMIFL